MQQPDDILEYPFPTRVIKNIKPSIAKLEGLDWVLDENDEFFRIKNPPKLNSQERYHWDIFRYLTNLTGAVDRLKEIQVYLSRFPNPRIYDRKGITQDKWIKYHYGNFIVTMVTIHDAALILVNAVYMLGLNPKDCNENTVSKNTRIRNTSVGEALAELDEATKEYRYPRNLQLHRGEPPEISVIQMQEALSILQRVGSPLLEANELDKLYRAPSSEIVTDLDSRTKMVINQLSHLFDALLAQYELQSEFQLLVEKSFRKK